jgi:hypothetical protein
MKRMIIMSGGLLMELSELNYLRRKRIFTNIISGGSLILNS